MRTGTDELWSLADLLGVVPAPPDEELARRLSDWWDIPRSFGCVTATASAWWHVVAPSPSIWCASCAEQRLAEERRCIYCGQRVWPRRADLLAYEMRGRVRVLARAHPACQMRNA